MTRTAILISGGGSNMVALVRSMAGDHPARPVLVIASGPDAAGIGRARSLGVPAEIVDRRAHRDRAGFEAEIDTLLRRSATEIVCLAGFMHVLSAGFVDRWQRRLLNIHPSLLPRHRGLDTHARVLAAGEPETGCTVHEVTADLDAGPMLGQARVPVLPGDTAEALGLRVLGAEHVLYPAVLRRAASGNRTPLHLP
jgi:phosphoribosylglycinamide formyltransferase-1